MPESPTLISRVLGPFERFAAYEAAGGIVLLICTVIALGWANSPWAASYAHLWEQPVGVALGPWTAQGSLHHLINDGLMAVFFFLVGLEIKREVLTGELASFQRAALPMAGAIGGMVVPALCFVALNAGRAGANGWGIPMATDIAFALGVLALLGNRVPASLKVFLAALAIADDIGAILVIAIFYSAGINWTALGAAAGLLVLAMLANLAGVRRPLAYAVIGLGVWAAVFQSGIHATVAGVALALTIPTSTALDLEHRLHGVVAFLIVPLFALANAGVAIHGSLGTALAHPITLGILTGLVLGKPIGITLVSWLAVRTGIAAKPADVSWSALHAVSWLGGIGFTMSLFVAGLAFGNADTAPLLEVSKVGILAASAIAGVAGWAIIRTVTRRITA